jgi:succinate dehydrogenase / fumarate reductase, flavoprotein subunit
MSRTQASCELAIKKFQELRAEFWQNVSVTGTNENLNTALERAGRVADFLEFNELLAYDALTRNESCGGHFREEYQYPDGEALRDDENFAHAAAFEYKGSNATPVRHKEELVYEFTKRSVRSYK